MAGPILIVEDLEDLSEMMALVLQKQGYQTVVAGSLAEARLLWEARNGFDMIIADALLPDGSGLRLASELSRRKPSLRVIITTGNLDDALPPEYNLLLKPFNLQNFIQLVRSRFTPGPD